MSAGRAYRLPAATRAAVTASVLLGMSSLRAEPQMRLADWAAEHYVLTAESSHEAGGWRAWPIQVGILDWMSDKAVAELYVQKSKRVGYTKMLVAKVAYNVAHARRKQALWQPTDDDRDSFVKSEIEPVFDQVPAVQAARRKGGRGDETISFKPFRDSVAHFLGGKAARAYRRLTVDDALLDEWDGFDQQIEKSSDPGTLAKGRLEGAAFPKFIGGSTPRLKGMSHVERAREAADVDVRYHITCPHCCVEHPLVWGGKDKAHGFKWDASDIRTVRHVCPHCHGAISQADYLRVWRDGAWVCVKTGARYGRDRVWRTATGEPMRSPRSVGVHLWAAYSPQREWVDIVREFQLAHQAMQVGDTGPMQGFTNETLGETWEVSGERIEEHALQQRAEDYPLRTVPAGCLVLTAGIDLQGSRWEIGVWGWGARMESWVIDHQVIEGNPTNDTDWDPVIEYLNRRYAQAWHGGTLGIEAVSLDTGHHTHPAYNFVRLQQHQRRIHAIKGASEEGKPIRGVASPQDVNWRGQKWRHGVKLWVIGTDTAKDLLHGQLQIPPPVGDEARPGYVHLNKHLPREWFEQLTAEQRVPVRSHKGETLRWVKRRARNEVLDCRIYAMHAAFMLGLDRYTDRKWEQLRAAVQPPRDLFSPPEPAPAIAVPAAPAIVVAPPPAAEPPPLASAPPVAPPASFMHQIHKLRVAARR